MIVTKMGDWVQIQYTGRLEDGTVFDSSYGRDPLEFAAGSDEVIQGVSNSVLGMKPGDSKTIEIAAEDAYGPRQPELKQRVSRHLLPQDVKLGDPLQAQSGDQTFVVWVMELEEEFAVLDANHPLSGRTLIFDIELLSVGSK